jgi:hypothetical protein
MYIAAAKERAKKYRIPIEPPVAGPKLLLRM